MRFKKLFAVEIVLLVAIVAALLFLVEVFPFLASSELSSSITVFSQRGFANDTVTLTAGQKATARAFVTFNYSTYDPSILVLDLLFNSWQNPGNLSIYCNDKIITTIYASSEKPQVTLNTVSFSGLDWVDSPTRASAGAINRIVFVSDENGYEGTFSYKLYMRGSR